VPPPTARDTFSDAGELLDVFQVLQANSGAILVGETIQGLSYGTKTAQDNQTATPSGNQSNSIKLTSINRFTTVASAGDSAVLPQSQPGYIVVVINDAAANSMNVFPAVGDKIDSGALNAAKAVGANSGPLIFYATGIGQWRTK
jgi:hypothetical protein